MFASDARNATRSTLPAVSNPAGQADLRLSVQRALLGAVGDSLDGACADLRDELIILTWYVEPDMPEDEREALEVAGSEVIADFPSSFGIDERFIESEKNAQA